MDIQTIMVSVAINSSLLYFVVCRFERKFNKLFNKFQANCISDPAAKRLLEDMGWRSGEWKKKN